jgi:phosphatidate phosphatase APP1
VTDQPRPLHRAARVEDRVHEAAERWLRRRGWRPRVVPFIGYGTEGWVRVLARVLLAPPDTATGEIRLGRGWRRFLTATAADVPVTVRVGGREHQVRSGRGGYVDAVLAADVEPGWAEAELSADGSRPSVAGIRVVDPTAQVAVLSDIDDTVLVTALPRPVRAAWNTFVRHESTRRPVHGMATLYRTIAAEHPDAPFVYLSTGAWNVAPVLEQFLARHAFPPGPLLMTDWGPTPDSWFRSGREHKRREIRRLLDDLPDAQWPPPPPPPPPPPDRVRAVVIRQLSPAEQVRTHGTPEPIREPASRPRLRPHQEVRAPDGFRLLSALRDRGVLGGP